MRSLAGRGGVAVCSRAGVRRDAAEWGLESVRAGGCGRVDGVARRRQDRGGASRVVRDRCLNFLRAAYSVGSISLECSHRQLYTGSSVGLDGAADAHWEPALQTFETAPQLVVDILKRQ